MPRRNFPRAVKIAAFERAGGRCEKCSAKLMVGGYHYDHVLPDGLGGMPCLDNCAVLCKACHKAKSANHDVPTMAKADRQKASHLGAKQSRNPMPGSRSSKWKRRMDGTVVRRT